MSENSDRVDREGTFKTNKKDRQIDREAEMNGQTDHYTQSSGLKIERKGSFIRR